MEHASGTDAYLNEVLAHVRWKKSHNVIRRELSDHIEDARLGFLAQGTKDSEAQEKAVLEMGDAADIGARFDKAYRPAKNYGVWIPFALLMLAGFFLRSYMAWSAEVFTFLVPVVFFGACFLRLEWFVKYAWPLYGTYLIALATSFFFPIVRSGSPASFYLPMLFPVLYALLIYRARGRGLMSIFLLGAAFVVQMIPYFYISSVIMAALVLICLFELFYAVLSGWFSCKKWHAALLILVPTLICTAWMLSRYANTISIRLPLLAEQGLNRETNYLSALISGILPKTSWFGAQDTATFTAFEQSELFGNSNIFMNDFFLVWLSARLGRIVFIVMGGLFAAFFAFALHACLKQRSMLYRLASLGITLHLITQFAGYFLANLGLDVFFTYPLPFISSGNAAMFFNAALMGLLFSMFHNGPLMDDGMEKKYPRWRVKIVKEMV